MEMRLTKATLDRLEKRVYQSVEDKFFQYLDEVGRETVDGAKQGGTYQNHTFNLRNANGFCVVRGGKVTDIYIHTDGQHPEAEESTRNLLLYSEHPKDGLYFANGMFYAGYVEAKNYDVIKHWIAGAEKKFEHLRISV